MNLKDPQLFHLVGIMLMLVGTVLYIYKKGAGQVNLAISGGSISLPTDSILIFVVGAIFFAFPHTPFFHASSDPSEKENRKEWFAAVSAGDMETLMGLVESGKINLSMPVDDQSNSALHLASARCNFRLIKYLLEHDGDPDLLNVWNSSSLQIAQKNCQGGTDSPQYKLLATYSSSPLIKSK
jgi:hypothetical protein